MKKLVLLSLGLLLSSITIIAQDTTKVADDSVKSIVKNIVIDNETQQGISAMKDGIAKMEKVISEKEDKVKIWNEELVTLSTDETLNETKIDSLKELIEVNEEIIEALEDGVEELNDGMEELQEATQELSDDFDVDLKTGNTDNNDDNDCDHKKKKKFKGHWAGMQLGLNSYVSPNNTINLPAESDFMLPQLNNSFEFDINPLQFSIPFFNRYVGAVTGVGFSFNNYELVHNISLGVDTDGNLTHSLSAVDYHKNRFKTFNLNIPLIIEFQIPMNKKDKRMFVGAGVIGTMSLSGKMKTIYTDGNSTVKYKDKSSNWPLSQFNYQATARFGYDDWYLFANYSMMPLFEKNKGPEIYPVSAGIGLNF